MFLSIILFFLSSSFFSTFLFSLLLSSLSLTFVRKQISPLPYPIESIPPWSTNTRENVHKGGLTKPLWPVCCPVTVSERQLSVEKWFLRVVNNFSNMSKSTYSGVRIISNQIWRFDTQPMQQFWCLWSGCILDRYY